MQDAFIASLLVKYSKSLMIFIQKGGRKRADVSVESETEEKESLDVLKLPLSLSEPHGQEAGS